LPAHWLSILTWLALFHFKKHDQRLARVLLNAITVPESVSFEDFETPSAATGGQMNDKLQSLVISRRGLLSLSLSL
jgi:hypothetical protein